MGCDHQNPEECHVLFRCTHMSQVRERRIAWCNQPSNCCEHVERYENHRGWHNEDVECDSASYSYERIQKDSDQTVSTQEGTRLRHLLASKDEVWRSGSD